MLVNHGVKADGRARQLALDFVVRHVDVELNAILELQIFDTLLQICQALAVGFVTASTDEDQNGVFNLARFRLELFQSLPGGDLNHVRFFRSKLPHANNAYRRLVLFHRRPARVQPRARQREFGQVFDVARGIHHP